MQEYTSLETSRKLFEMFGWGSDTEKIWRYHKPTRASELKYRAEQEADNYRFRNNHEAPRYRAENDFYPAYTLIYLLDKLPKFLEIEHPITLKLTLGVVIGGRWCASYDSENGNIKFEQFADTPVEAAALLCLELCKQGILTTKETK